MRRLVHALPAVIPAAFTLLLIVVWLRGNLYSYLPTTEGVYNDGVFYTRQIFTFRWMGMNGGYFTLNEQPAAAPYTPFYAHGPGYALVYGTLAKLVTPIFPQTIIVFHLIGITVGALIFLRLARLDSKGLLWFVAYIVACWGTLFYLPSAMQEGLHVTIAFILAGLAIGIIRDGPHAPLWMKIAFACLAGAAALTRPSWAFLLLPYALLAPQILIICIFFYLPAGQALWMSTLLQDPLGLSVQFVGLENFANVLGDPAYRQTIARTFFFSIMVTVLAMVPAILLALMADKVSGLHAAYATIAGLFAKAQTGKGQFIEAPMLVDAEGRRVNVLASGETYRYRFRVRFDQVARFVHFGMLIKSTSGVELCGVDSHAHGEGIDEVAAGSVVDVAFPFRASLLPGTYFLNAGCVGWLDGEGETYLHRIVDALAFRIETSASATRRAGFFDLALEPACEYVIGAVA
ncbi:hypothetical protein HC776_01315 [bacterium]|nr:hypothetical protein [bacterium]